MARAARRAEGLRAAIENAAGIYLPDRLHEVRIAVKKLRYALEIARDLSGSRATARIRTLKRVQDLLGRMHDLEMLIARTRADSEPCRRAESAACRPTSIDWSAGWKTNAAGYTSVT